MILDLQEMFSGTVAADGTKTGQALTATAISTNVLDLRNQATPVFVDEGISGGEVWLVVQVQTAANGADSAKTLTITLESATDTGLSSGNVAHFTSQAFTGAQLVAGFTAVRVQIPSALYRRYIGIRYTVSVAFTAFNVLAYLVTDVQRNVIYPVGFSVDV